MSKRAIFFCVCTVIMLAICSDGTISTAQSATADKAAIRFEPGTQYSDRGDLIAAGDDDKRSSRRRRRKDDDDEPPAKKAAPAASAPPTPPAGNAKPAASAPLPAATAPVEIQGPKTVATAQESVTWFSMRVMDRIGARLAGTKQVATAPAKPTLQKTDEKAAKKGNAKGAKGSNKKEAPAETKQAAKAEPKMKLGGLLGKGRAERKARKK